MELHTESVEDTRALGARVAAAAESGLVIALHGDLGAGKTAFSQGFARGLGIEGPVQSPTFVVIQEYDSGRLPLWHCDLYRVEDPAEVQHLGLDDLFDAGGVVLVEWPSRQPSALPLDVLHVHIGIGSGDHRDWRMEASGAVARKVLGRL